MILYHATVLHVELVNVFPLTIHAFAYVYKDGQGPLVKKVSSAVQIASVTCSKCSRLLIINVVCILVAEENPCYNNSCMNGASCLPNFNLTNYECFCANGFTGQYCEFERNQTEGNQ